jgi:predicted transcriptional regulator
MRILLSIKPEYAEKILGGEKQFEFRKAVFKNPAVRTAVIYATRPHGKVIGKFDNYEVLSDRPHALWSQTSNFSGISKQYFDEYFHGRTTGFAVKIREARRYDHPLDLGDVLKSGVAPQSFCYLIQRDITHAHT